MARKENIMKHLFEEMPLPLNFHGIGKDATKSNTKPRAEREEQAKEANRSNPPKEGRLHFEDIIDF